MGVACIDGWIWSVSPHLVEDLSDFGIGEVFVNLLGTQADELVAVIVNPVFVVLALQDVLAAVVVRLDGQRLLVLIEGNLVVVDHNLEVLSGNSLVHDDPAQFIDRLAGVEDVIDEEDLVAGSQVLGRVGPPIDHHVGLVAQVAIGAGNHRSVEDRPPLLPDPDHLVVLAEDIGHVRTTSERGVDDVRDEVVFFVHLVGEFQRHVTDRVTADEFLLHRASLLYGQDLQAIGCYRYSILKV